MEPCKSCTRSGYVKIKTEISNNKSLLNSREPIYGQTLLQLAVVTDKYHSTRTLLELGADPNIQDSYDGSSPMLEAAQFGYEKDFPDTSDSKYLKLLIEYGGDVNKEQKGSNPKGNDTKYTPLMIACDYGLFENVKVLIDAGANINYKNGYGQAALQTAVITQRADVVLYLLKKGAVYNETMNLSQNLSRNFYITDILRDWTFELGSEKYKKKMEIVDWLAQHGMSYRNTPIPKNLYGLYSKDYLNNY